MTGFYKAELPSDPSQWEATTITEGIGTPEQHSDGFWRKGPYGVEKDPDGFEAYVLVGDTPFKIGGGFGSFEDAVAFITGSMEAKIVPDSPEGASEAEAAAESEGEPAPEAPKGDEEDAEDGKDAEESVEKSCDPLGPEANSVGKSESFDKAWADDPAGTDTEEINDAIDAGNAAAHERMYNAGMEDRIGDLYPDTDDEGINRNVNAAQYADSHPFAPEHRIVAKSESFDKVAHPIEYDAETGTYPMNPSELADMDRAAALSRDREMGMLDPEADTDVFADNPEGVAAGKVASEAFHSGGERMLPSDTYRLASVAENAVERPFRSQMDERRARPMNMPRGAPAYDDSMRKSESFEKIQHPVQMKDGRYKINEDDFSDHAGAFLDAYAIYLSKNSPDPQEREEFRQRLERRPVDRERLDRNPQAIAEAKYYTTGDTSDPYYGWTDKTDVRMGPHFEYPLNMDPGDEPVQKSDDGITHETDVDVPRPGEVNERHYIDDHALGSARLMSDAPSLEAFERSVGDFRSLMFAKNAGDADMYGDESFAKKGSSLYFNGENVTAGRGLSGGKPQSIDRTTIKQRGYLDRGSKVFHPTKEFQGNTYYNADGTPRADLAVDRHARSAPGRVDQSINLNDKPSAIALNISPMGESFSDPEAQRDRAQRLLNRGNPNEYGYANQEGGGVEPYRPPATLRDPTGRSGPTDARGSPVGNPKPKEKPVSEAELRRREGTLRAMGFEEGGEFWNNYMRHGDRYAKEVYGRALANLSPKQLEREQQRNMTGGYAKQRRQNEAADAREKEILEGMGITEPEPVPHETEEERIHRLNKEAHEGVDSRSKPPPGGSDTGGGKTNEAGERVGAGKKEGEENRNIDQSHKKVEDEKTYTQRVAEAEAGKKADEKRKKADERRAEASAKRDDAVMTTVRSRNRADGGGEGSQAEITSMDTGTKEHPMDKNVRMKRERAAKEHPFDVANAERGFGRFVDQHPEEFTRSDDPSGRSFRDMVAFEKARHDDGRGHPLDYVPMGHEMREGRPIRELYRTVTMGRGKDCSSSPYDPERHTYE